MTDSATKTASRFQSQLRGDPKTKGPTQKLKCATLKPECTIPQPKLPKQKCHIFGSASQDIKSAYPLWIIRCTLSITRHHPRISPPPPLNTLLHLQGHKTVALAPPLNNTPWDISPATPSEHYVASSKINPATSSEHHVAPWGLQDISPATLSEQYVASWASSQDISPVLPLKNTLHLEHRKTSTPPSPPWRLCCIFSITLGSL